LVLAAGGSVRMGRPKQLLPVRGRPLLERVLIEVNDSNVDEVLVVLGGHAEAIAAAVDFGRARFIVNLDFGLGMSSSLKSGVQALGPEVDRIIIILGDQPDVTAALINELLLLQTTSGRPSSALDFDGLLHPPVVLQRILWDELAELQGDVGCRALIRGHRERVAALPMGVPGGHPVDIDTLDDYRRLVREQAE
jgi:molybdenum cofactor cytidylyltransferase